MYPPLLLESLRTFRQLPRASRLLLMLDPSIICLDESIGEVLSLPARSMTVTLDLVFERVF